MKIKILIFFFFFLIKFHLTNYYFYDLTIYGDIREMTDLQIQTNYYEKTEIEKITEILKQLNLKETTESAESMLKLIDFFCELNKVEKPTLDLDSINSFMQKNFFTKIPILGIVPIMNKEKIKIMEQHRSEIERCFETIGFYNQPRVNREDINDIVNILGESGNNRLIVRIMGNNELILEQQFKRVREILEQIPEEVRGQVNVKLLGKTNINMFFGEDRESEILIMKRLAKLWLDDLGCQTDAVATFGEANTINTIVKEENSRTTVNGESIVIDILCPNGAERQMEDIELYKSKKKKRILEKILKIGDELEKTNNEFKRKELRQEIDNLNDELLEKENERHYFDGCGGIKQLRDVLNNNIEGVDCDEHQLCYQYYYNKELNKFDKWIVENDFKRFVNLTGRLNGVFYPNMFCEIAKHIYSKLQHIKTQKEIDLLETRRELNNSFPIENIISIDK